MNDFYIASFSLDEDYLSHHGIKNMHWGEKNGPPYPLSRKEHDEIVTGKKEAPKGTYIIKAGTKQSHVSSGKKKLKLKDQIMYTYDPLSKLDSSIYKGPYSEYIKVYKKKNPVNHNYVTSRDLLVGKVEMQREVFNELNKKDKHFSDETDAMLFNVNYSGRLGTSGVKRILGKDFDRLIREDQEYGGGYLKDSIKNLNDKDKETLKFIAFNLYAEQVNNYYSTREFINSFKNMGLDAIEDANNKVIYNSAENPLIILNGKISLKEVGKPEKINDKEMEIFEDYVRKMNGGHLMLSGLEIGGENFLCQ